MVVVNTEWTVTRLKRELRFLELVPRWHWCKALPHTLPPPTERAQGLGRKEGAEVTPF